MNSSLIELVEYGLPLSAVWRLAPKALYAASCQVQGDAVEAIVQ